METIVHIEDGEYLGQTKFASSLLRESLMLSIKEVAGVAGLGKTCRNHSHNIKIKRSKDSNHLIIDVYITVSTGYTVPDVAYHVQEAIINAVAQFTSEKIDHVNVFVKGAKYGTSAKQK